MILKVIKGNRALSELKKIFTWIIYLRSPLIGLRCFNNRFNHPMSLHGSLLAPSGSTRCSTGPFALVANLDRIYKFTDPHAQAYLLLEISSFLDSCKEATLLKDVETAAAGSEHRRSGSQDQY